MPLLHSLSLQAQEFRFTTLNYTIINCLHFWTEAFDMTVQVPMSIKNEWPLNSYSFVHSFDTVKCHIKCPSEISSHENHNRNLTAIGIWYDFYGPSNANLTLFWSVLFNPYPMLHASLPAKSSTQISQSAPPSTLISSCISSIALPNSLSYSSWFRSILHLL